MKKLISILFISTALLVVGCTDNKVETNNEVILENKDELKDEHIVLLDGSKTYGEMNSEEKAMVVEILEKWEKQSEDFKTKYFERKEVISQSRDEVLKQWTDENEKEEESKNIKEELSIKINNELVGYEVLSSDILTLNAGGYSASIQIISDVENSIELAKEVGNKIKEIIPVFDIRIIDSKYQITASVDNENL